MYSKILFPTDFSPCAEKAISYIIQLRDSGAKEVIVLHVVDDFCVEGLLKHCKMAGFEPEEFKKLVLDEMISENEEMVEGVKKILIEAGFQVSVRIEFGKPVKEICKIAEEENISVIVMGAKGKGALKSMILGSVSEGTVRNAHVPVLVIH
ncbi:MAG: universal stress protein [Methanospirillaceae archaeon]|nr:universal stress protein [Methanospirillaceae archaeon]